MIEESDSLIGQFGYIYQSGSIRMTVDQSVSQEVSSLFGVQDVHGSEMFVFRTDADNFFRYFDGIAVFGVQSGDESVCVSGFNHHHTEVVALEHLVVGLFVCSTFAGTLLREDVCIALTAFRFTVVAEVDDFDSVQAQVEFFGQFLDALFVT